VLAQEESKARHKANGYYGVVPMGGVAVALSFPDSLKDRKHADPNGRYSYLER